MKSLNRRHLFKLITAGALGAATYKGTMYYCQNIYPNRTVDTHFTIERYKNNKLVELKQYRYRSLNELEHVQKCDDNGKVTSNTYYDDNNKIKSHEEYKNGQLSYTTYYYNGNIIGIDEYENGNRVKYTSYINNKVTSMATYNKRGDITSEIQYNDKGETTKEIKYDIVISNKPIVTKLLDSKGRDCVLDKGEVIVWKPCTIEDDNYRKIQVKIKLLVPDDAKRLTTTNNTTLVSKAKVLKITDKNGNKYDRAKCIDGGLMGWIYVNETITCRDFDDSGHDSSKGMIVSKFKD